MKVIELQVQNYMGVKAVQLKPQGNIIKIEGKNGAGKSSVINSIWAAIGGKNEIPDKAIHEGQKDARIFVDLGEINVERKFTENGTYLYVRNKDGMSFSSPQKVLDDMFTKVSMDPVAFIAMKPSQRRELLLEMTGKKDELEKFELEKKEAYDNRRIINREINTVEGKLSNAPEDENIEEKSVTVLTERLEKERDRERALMQMNDEIAKLENSIEDYIKELKNIENSIVELKDRRDKFLKLIQEQKEKKINRENMLKSLPSPAIIEVQEELKTVDEYNAHVRAVKEAKRLRKELEQLKVKSDNCTAKIKQCDNKKIDILKKSDLPLDKLEFEGDMLIINGLPFDNINQAEQLKISMRIGLAQNPKLRVLRIEHGGDIDGDSIKEIEEFASKNDCQIWIQKVCDSPEGGVFIQEGEIINK